MDKKILMEEINRFKLLSNYSNRKTLSENQSELDEVIIPNVSKWGRKSISQATQSLAKLGGYTDLTKYFKFAGRVEDEVIQALTKSADEMASDIDNAILKDIADGNKTPQLGGVAKNSSKDLAIQLANEMSATRTTKYFGETYTLDELAQSIDKGFSVKTGQPLKDINQAKTVLKQNQDAVMKDAVDKAKNYAEKRKIELLKKDDGGGGGGGNTPPPPIPDPWKKWSWKKVALVAGGATLATFLAWWLFSSKNGTNPFPPCLSQGFTEKDLEKLKQTAPKLPINSLPVVSSDGTSTQLTNTLWNEPNAKGVGTLEINGAVAEWFHDKASDIIKVRHEGNIYIINCGVININTDDKKPVPPITRGCKPCSGFPQGFYCRSSEIEEIQGCVGASVDGCLGPETARKTGEFLGTSPVKTITKDIYDQVKAKCGKSPSTTTTTTSITFGGDTSDIENM